MRRVATALVLATCLAFTSWTAPAARAQGIAVAVTFQNEMKTPVIVQGATLVNGMPKAGMAMIVLPGKTATENIPANSIRFYIVVDANRPGLRYINNLPVPAGVQDINLAIRGIPPKVFIKAVP